MGVSDSKQGGAPVTPPRASAPPPEPIPHAYTVYSVERTPTRSPAADNDLPTMSTTPIILASSSSSSSLSPSSLSSPAEPEVAKLLSMPLFSPLIHATNKKGAPITPDDMSAIPMLTMLAHYQEYLRASSEHISRAQEVTAHKMYTAGLTTEKAYSLLAQSSQNFKNFENGLKPVDFGALSSQLGQAHKVLEGISVRVWELYEMLPAEEAVESGCPPCLHPSVLNESYVLPPTPRIASLSKSPSQSLTPNATSPGLSSTPGGAGMDVVPQLPKRTNLTIWQEDILPRWDEVHDAPWVKDLWRKGIEPQVRGPVWVKAIGNALKVSRDLYLTLVSYDSGHQYTAVSQTSSSSTTDPNIIAINLDLPRTFSQIAVPLPLPPDIFRRQLASILMAYARFRPDLGYVQGMSYLAAMLMLHIHDEYDAFVAFANLLEKDFMQALFRLDMATLAPYIQHYSVMFAQLLPKLHAHFQDLGFDHMHYLFSMWLPLFTKTLPMNIARKVWDLCLLEGEGYLFVVSLGLAKTLSPDLQDASLDKCRRMLTNGPLTDVDERALFRTIDSIPIPSFFASSRGGLFGAPGLYGAAYSSSPT
eukprot:TRINITY_DN655_c1_g1_i4.p1 TRINITY_DN655_c1_g1~~TRINITY_DN655_c1_g1_i4.p1  ORF type:complete len:588 (-),score=175.45 TRINITY_DN655_c1_g1_i4:221-1984(-)